MALESFTKQPYEEFVIAGDFVKVLEIGEAIILGTSAVTAINKGTGKDSTSIVLDTGTKTVVGSQLRMRCRAGVTKENHKVTFRIVTDQDNKWEIDVNMLVREY